MMAKGEMEAEPKDDVMEETPSTKVEEPPPLALPPPMRQPIRAKRPPREDCAEATKKVRVG